MSREKSAAIVFPHQLFLPNPAVDAADGVYLVEEQLFFREVSFHKQKLAFHRATMAAYQNELEGLGYTVEYVRSGDSIADVRALIPHLAEVGIQAIHICEVADDWLARRIDTAAKACGIEVVSHRSPGFLNSAGEIVTKLKSRKRYFQTDFYIAERKSRRIMVAADGEPHGGKWSFDQDNRKRVPAGLSIPKVWVPGRSKYLEDAISSVEDDFLGNPGELGSFNWAVTRADARKMPEQFLLERFEVFGDYEDAIVRDEKYLFHSVLSPYLNTGLLTPDEVIDAAIEHAEKHDMPINSLEGFIRQIIGWREFIRGVYEIEGRRQRTTNFWKFTRPMPSSFYDGTTGLEPFDATIQKVLETGYCHHIERLMVIGNLMLLCEIDPDEVYRWFMELFIDAYDWVMVPNTYGMSQFADGGSMTTKPYFSGSNYILKMSDYRKGEWCEIWDGLFWRFMDNHREFLIRNPRLGMLVRSFDKMPSEKRAAYHDTAESFLASLN
ncbi:MAG: cryptochrome/photolyase family protein [Acidobacteria bacterium]|nr:cryptochrome/photolyase family protein [Acidobacteriota bacterium]